jgi:alpha-beta hydrolase superfamily lysophospholipase
VHTTPPRIQCVPAADGYPLCVRRWDAQGTPLARVVCLHGIISHGGWYGASCSHLAAAGYEVHFLDRRGSGLNALARGDVDRYETWLDDVENHLDRLPRGEPRILVGISWGGKLAAAVARHRPWLLDGLALLCPGICAQTKASRLQRRGLAWADRLRLHRRRVAVPLREPALFTDNTAWHEYIRTDPLTLRQITLRFAVNDLRLDRYVSDAAPSIRTPTLLMTAGRDRIIDNAGLHRFYGQLAAADKQHLDYPQAAHTFEFEPDPQPYFDDLVQWLSRVVSTL